MKTRQEEFERSLQDSSDDYTPDRQGSKKIRKPLIKPRGFRRHG